MVRVLIFCDLSENLDSEEDILECPLQVSAPALRKPLAEYRPEKSSVVHTVFLAEKRELSPTL